MPVNSTHPQYDKALKQRQLVRDVCEGSQVIKDKGDVYLPRPNAKDLTDENRARFESYLARAVFYEITKETSLNYVGRAFTDDPSFEPKGLDYLANDANGAGISIYQQAQAVLREQLEQGGCGLLVDYPTLEQPASIADQESKGIRATITLYHALNIINWRVTKKGNKVLTTLVVLAEKANKIDPTDAFKETDVNQWRVLKLDEDGFYCVEIWQDDNGQPKIQSTNYPLDAKGKKFSEILFQPVGAFANDWTVDSIPLEPIARVNLAHYHNSADYEDSVFICGQIQPVITGLTEQWAEMLKKDGVYIGSRTPLMLPEHGGFTFAQAQPNMLAFEAMTDKLKMMKELGARLVEQGSANKTATQSNMDSSTQHSILSLCVANLNEAYINCLAWIAQFMGAGADATFTVKQDFSQSAVDVQFSKQIYDAALAGKISWATYWDLIRTGKLPEHGYLREQMLIENPDPSDVPA